MTLLKTRWQIKLNNSAIACSEYVIMLSREQSGSLLCERTNNIHACLARFLSADLLAMQSDEFWAAGHDSLQEETDA